LSVVALDVPWPRLSERRGAVGTEL